MTAPRESQDIGNVDQALEPGPIKPGTDKWDPSQIKLCSEFTGGEWKTFYDMLPSTDDDFILSIDGRKPLTFNELKAFIGDPKNNIPGMGRSDRLCTALPNGPEHAVAYMVFSMRCTFAPLNLFYRAEEYEFEYDDLPAKGLLVQNSESLKEDEKKGTGTAVASARRKKLAIIIELKPDPNVAGLFSWDKHAAGKKLDGAVLEKPLESVSRDDICLVLHTSGTTKKPKIVPITHESMAVGCKSHSVVNQMEAEDVFINTMPMFHIAGLMENLLMSGVAGARVVCLPGVYQAHIFHDNLIKEPFPTTYSAVPMQHLSLINHAKEIEKFEKKEHKNSLKFIRNDSAALLPSMAEQMEDYLKASVMPAYSMTECNPLTSNPRYGTRKLKSVGPMVGPEMKIMAGYPENTLMGSKEPGEVVVKGACVMKGYELRDHMDKDPNIETFTDGYMRSGDKGWVDEEGYLYLLGRFKELINRSGEKISPFAVEDAIRKHAQIKDVLCFSCPHVNFGESVGVVVVLKDPTKKLEIFDLRQAMMDKNLLADKWCPEVMVIMKELPKGATGKPARINLAKRLELEPLDGTMRTIEHPGL